MAAGFTHSRKFENRSPHSEMQMPKVPNKDYTGGSVVYRRISVRLAALLVCTFSPAIDAYSISLEKTIVDTIVEALANLSPATLSAGEGRGDGAPTRRACSIPCGNG